MPVTFAPIVDREPTWYDEYLSSPHWQEVRRAALERAEHRCQLCNSDVALQVHHRTYRRLGGERDTDLTVLCRTCHETFHQSGVRVDATAWEPATWTKVVVEALITVALVIPTYDEASGWKIRVAFLVATSSDEDRIRPATDLVRDYHYKLHDNGTPWGGSTYRKLVESVYGRKLRKREQVIPSSLVGKEITLEIQCYDNREWEPRMAFA